MRSDSGETAEGGRVGEGIEAKYFSRHHAESAAEQQLQIFFTHKMTVRAAYNFSLKLYASFYILGML